METFLKDVFEFMEVKMLSSDQVVGVGIMVGLSAPNGMGLKGSGILLVTRKEE